MMDLESIKQQRQATRDLYAALSSHTQEDPNSNEQRWHRALTAIEQGADFNNLMLSDERLSAAMLARESWKRPEKGSRHLDNFAYGPEPEGNENLLAFYREIRRGEYFVPESEEE